MAKHDQTQHDPHGTLVGRLDERAFLDQLADAVRRGESRVLVVRGDAGIGKTALLGDLAKRNSDLPVIRLVGAHTEAQLPYAAIQRLAIGMRSEQGRLPDPQRAALRVAIGLESGPPPDRFLVGLAVHSLLIEASTGGPLLVIIDDLPWLDRESINALAFAARRLGSEGVGVVVGERGENQVDAFADFPVLEVGGLPPADAQGLLRRVITRRLDPRISGQIVTATGGNPLAIIDLAQELSSHQLVGLTLLPEPLPIGSHLEKHYQQLTKALPVDVQTWLLVAAAEPTGDPAYVASAAAVLGIDINASDIAESGNLVTVGNHIEFRHPLVRSAIYVGATNGQLRRVHTALGAVTRRQGDADRRVWHLAAGSIGPDEQVATLLEQAADRARDRGGYSARASFLVRAVEMSPDGPARVTRTLLAGEAALMAGQPVQALALLGELQPDSLDDMDLGRCLMIQASAEAFSGAPGAMARVPAICEAAAAAFGATAPDLARDAMITAFERTLSAEWMMSGTTLQHLADSAERLVGNDRRAVVDLVLTALAELARGLSAASVPRVKAAVQALRADDLPDGDVLRFGWVSVALSTAIWDDEAQLGLLSSALEVAGKVGAVHTVDALLFILAECETVLGQLACAADHLAGLRKVRDALGMSEAQQEMFRNIEYLAWRGEDTGLRDSIALSTQAALALGLGGAETMARTALMIVEMCAGDYEAAYQIASHIEDLRFMQISIRVLPDLVETAARSGRARAAMEALDDLRELTTASGTQWALGLLERSAGVVAETADPEPHYAAAIEHLGSCHARADLARTHLMYGEWLRRQKRRRDARAQLQAAVDHFQDMGATAFAARARRELAATGAEVAVYGGDSPWSAARLTAQEAEVARLAADGSTNAEIAAALSVSPHTVDYHLRKIYRKLGITTRRELIRVVRTPPVRG